MPSTAELLRKENDVLKRAQHAHRTRVKKLESSVFKRIAKLIKQTDFFEYDFSDEEFISGINQMCSLKGPLPVFEEKQTEASSSQKKKASSPDSKKSEKRNVANNKKADASDGEQSEKPNDANNNKADASDGEQNEKPNDANNKKADASDGEQNEKPSNADTGSAQSVYLGGKREVH